MSMRIFFVQRMSSLGINGRWIRDSISKSVWNSIQKARELLSLKKSRVLLEIFFLFFDGCDHILYISDEDILALIAEI